MGAGNRTAAVYAGLVGASVWAFPTPALAIPLQELVTPEMTPYLHFTLGCLAGAALSTTVHMTVSTVVKARRSRREAEGVAVIRRMMEMGTDPVSESVDSAERPVAASRAMGRHMAARDWEASGVIRVQEVEAEPVSRHSKASSEPTPQHSKAVSEPASQRPQAAEPARRHAKPASSEMARQIASTAGKAPRHARASEGVSPQHDKAVTESHAAHASSEDSKESSLGMTLGNRMSSVANVLASRLGTGPLEGIPVIERADGTVGDIGTSWWVRAHGSSIRHFDDIPKELLEPVKPPRRSAKSGHMASPDQSAASTSGSTAATYGSPAHQGSSDGRDEHFERSIEASERSEYISKNVAEVNIGVYPEQRSAAELDREDVWELALAAMDERIGGSPNQVFPEGISNISTIEEPDELDGTTGFIPFKLPAGHPEVVDASSYVDYLIEDEFSRNPSSAARKSSREFLTVIQGGSQRMRPTSPKSEEAPRRPKHFASDKPLLAKEA